MQVLLSELGVVVDDLGQVDQADLGGGFGAPVFEDRFDYAEEDWRAFIDRLLVEFLGLDGGGRLEIAGFALGLVLADLGSFVGDR